MLNKIMDRDKNLAGANILVTGGAGFIGSNICDYLITCRAKVRCFDNFSTGSKRNIIHLTKNKNLIDPLYAATNTASLQILKFINAAKSLLCIDFVDKVLNNCVTSGSSKSLYDW